LGDAYGSISDDRRRNQIPSDAVDLQGATVKYFKEVYKDEK